MGLLARISASLPFRKPSPAAGSSFVYSRPAAGIIVTEDTALRYAAFWTCVRVRGETMASLPWHLLEYADGGRKKIQITDDPLAFLLKFSPNPEMSIFDWVIAMCACVDVWGNAYAPIERTNGGDVLNVWWPLHPARVEQKRDERTDELYYEVRDDGGNTTKIAAMNMFHVKGLTLDGLTGLSVVQYHRETLAHGIAAERFGANLFGQGLRPSGTVEVPGKLTPDGEQALQKRFNEVSAGIGNSGRMMLLSGGMKWTPMSMKPDDAQFIETGINNRRQIYALMRVPPHKAGDLEHAHYNNIEHEEIAYATDVALPMALRFEQEAQRKLIPQPQRLTRFTRMNISGLLRGDMKSRFEAHNVARIGGWRSANDIRRIEDEDLIDEAHADRYWRPANMAFADEPTQPLASGNAPPPDDEDEEERVSAIHAVLALRFEAAYRKELSAVTRHKDDSDEKRIAHAGKFYGEHAVTLSEAFAECLAPLQKIFGAESGPMVLDLATDAAATCFRVYCTARNEFHCAAAAIDAERYREAWEKLIAQLAHDTYRILGAKGGA